MADNDSGTLNLSLDALKGGKAIPLQTGTRSVSRDEQRARSTRMGTAERARAIAEQLRPSADSAPSETPKADDQAQRPSNAPQSEPAAPEEVDPAPPADVESDSTASQEDDTVPENLADFAKTLELDEGYLRELQVPIKVNGRTEMVSIGDAVKNHQFAKANHERATALTAKERAHEAQAAERMQQYETLVEQGKAAHVAAAQVLQQELHQPDIQALKTSDPGAFIQYQDLIGRRVEQLKASLQKLLAHEQQTRDAHFEEVRRAGLARLRDAIPDFDTPDRAKKLERTFVEFGATKEDLAKVTDDRILLLVSKYADAMERLAEYEAADKAGKRRARQLVEQSNSARPSARQPRDRGSRKAIDAAKQNIKGKRGFAARMATANALNTILTEGRKRKR